jgi:phosphoribosylamine--glycine ligase
VKVLVVGGGAREHALCAAIARSPLATSVLCAPGNGGTAAVAGNAAVGADDIPALVELARANAIEFAVIGPEAPLVLGVVDALQAAGILTFGPNRAAAQLEGSKVFSKGFMVRHGVPTAAAATFSDADAAAAHVRAHGKAFVVKADGLASGKGVVVANDVAETLDAIDRIMRKREFGASGERVLLEQRLIGEEVSFHVVMDGERYVPLAAAQDHKRLRDGDQGPNTGGMGAYSPPPVVTHAVEQKILDKVVRPTLAGLRSEGIAYRGALFIGLMISEGEPYVIEYNTRFGDPETQVLLARYQGDVLPLLLAAARGDLTSVRAEFKLGAAICVVVAPDGYPGPSRKGLPIRGLEAAAAFPGVAVHHAGTRREGDTVVTTGGRTLSVTAAASDIDAAAEQVYAALARIEFEGAHFRRDIAWRARKRDHA